MYLYCLGVYQYRYIHHDFSVSRSCSTTRVSILKIRVAITGFRAPAKLDMITLQEFRAFNQHRIPFFKAWGILALVGDTCIWVASEPKPSPSRGEADDSDVLSPSSKG
jgi:hypothetical protein